MKSRVLLTTALAAVLIAGAGYFIGERHGFNLGSAGIRQATTMALESRGGPSNTSSNREFTDEIASDQELAHEIARVRSVRGLILPKKFYLVAGQPLEIYWRGIILAKDPETFVYNVNCTCDFASSERRRIAFAPPIDASGEYEMEIAIADTKGQTIDRQRIDLVVVPGNAGEGTAFQMLLIGDSLGHQSRFPNQLARLLAQPGNPNVTFVGSFKPAGAEIPHEQYGGWRFIYFTTVFNQDPKSYHRDRSPFVFGLVDGKPVVDVKRYLDETLGGARPRNIHIQLGINDAFTLSPDDPDLDRKLSEIMDHAETLIAALRKALPDAVITVGSVVQANMTDRAFVESYPAYPQLQSEWRWRRVQMKLARVMIDHFETAQSPNVYVVPTHMTVDPLDGYNAHNWTPEGVDYRLSNAVHPSHTGDKQLAAAIYGVVKAELRGLLKKD